jgi:uncharacterized membrane protein
MAILSTALVMKERVKTVFKVLMGLLYIAAGTNHFRNPALYVSIMPPYLPFHLELVYLSGILEILLGVLLLIPRYSHLAAWGIIALLIAIFPANINMALHPELTPQFPNVALWLRLPLQVILILWAYWFTR